MKTFRSLLSFRTLSTVVVVVVVVAAAAACTDGTGAIGTGTVVGTVKNTTLDAASAVVYPSFVGARDGVDILISSAGNDCSNEYQKNEKTLDFQFDVAPIAGQTYTVTDVTGAATKLTLGANEVGASFAINDATCGDGAGEGATSGTLTVFTTSPVLVTGTFDVTFGDGHVSGGFDAFRCTAADGPLDPTCS